MIMKEVYVFPWTSFCSDIEVQGIMGFYNLSQITMVRSSYEETIALHGSAHNNSFPMHWHGAQVKNKALKREKRFH